MGECLAGELLLRITNASLSPAFQALHRKPAHAATTHATATHAADAAAHAAAAHATALHRKPALRRRRRTSPHSLRAHLSSCGVYASASSALGWGSPA